MKKSLKKIALLALSFAMTVTVLMSLLTLPAAAYSSYSSYNNSRDIYLKVDGIDGESKDSKHERWIDVITFTHTSVQSVQTGSPDAAGRGIFEPFVFKHVVDKATPKFQEACMKGSHIKCAELHFCRAISGKQEVVYKVKLDGVKVVKATVEVEELEEGQIRLVETVNLLVNKQTWTETAVGLDNVLGGNTEACFDQSKKATMIDTNSSETLSPVIIIVIVALVLAAVVIVVLVGNNKRKKKLAQAVDENK